MATYDLRDINRISSSVPDDYAGSVTRPSDYFTEVSLSLRENQYDWSKFAQNTTINTGSTEYVWEAGVVFTPLSAPETFTISYNNTTDGEGTNGALELTFWYLNSTKTAIVEEKHTLGSTGSDVTSFTGYGFNRVKVTLAGSNTINVNDITITATTSGTVQAFVEADHGVTEQMMFYTPKNSQCKIYTIYFRTAKTSGGIAPRITILGFYLRAGVKTRFFEEVIDASEDPVLQVPYTIPKPIPDDSVYWFEVTTSVNNTFLRGEIAQILFTNKI